jgi:hypothetical protein
MPALGNLGDYLVRLPVFVNGVPCEEVTSVEMTLDSGRSTIFTTTKGLAGFAEGAKSVKIRVNLAVPVSGLEVDVWKLANSGDYVTMQIGVGRGDFASTTPHRCTIGHGDRSHKAVFEGDELRIVRILVHTQKVITRSKCEHENGK